MTNRDTQAALRYHEITKHSPESIRRNRHFLDWEIQPLPFKIYKDLDPIPLPRDWAPSKVPTLEAIASPGPDRDRAVIPDLKELARLLYLSAGITRRKVYPGGQVMHFRAAACTGALYHIDLYLVCGDVEGLEAGVYHFDPHDFALRRLRRGDFRAVVIEASGNEPAVSRAPALVICTSTFWRNTWKYQSRAYRHCFWDCGTLLANLLAVAAADAVPTRLVLGFADIPVNQLLGLDTDREVALSIVTVGYDPQGGPAAAPSVDPLSFATVPLSAREVDYPAIRAAHEASSLASGKEVQEWRSAKLASYEPPGEGRIVTLAAGSSASETLDATILRRGSTRHFSQRPISAEALSAILRNSIRGVRTDYASLERGATATSLTDLCLILHAVEGLFSGTYFYRGDGKIELLERGEFRRESGFLDLGQELAHDAAVNFYFMADLKRVLECFGNRGYRAAQLEAAIMGGRLYLAAYALRLGATGLTFFDDAVTEFFSPRAAGKSVMFLVAAGRPRRST
jgi:SagB-type dehydrogenase family enzyme